MVAIDIGIFAHNESGQIGPMLRSLLAQDIFDDPAYSINLHVLANGCSDDTVAEARQEIEAYAKPLVALVHDFPEGGKSRTWNRFVHEVSRADADILVAARVQFKMWRGIGTDFWWSIQRHYLLVRYTRRQL